MLIAITGDGHCDERSRFDEWKRVHAWMADDWYERGVSLVLNAGDLYERKSTPDERNAMAAWVRKVGQTAEQIIVRGNHDAMHDLLLLQELHTNHKITVLEHPQVVSVGTNQGPGPLVACLPWPRKAGILKHAADLGIGNEGAELLVHDALQQILRGLGQQAEMVSTLSGGRRPKILLSHAMVRAATTSLGQPLVGCDMEVGLDDLRLAKCDLYALGHIHRHQEWKGIDEADMAAKLTQGDVLYAGSPRRTAFGEVEEKSYVLYDTDTGSWQRIPTPCTPMLLWEAEWQTDSDGNAGFTSVFGPGAEGAEIRFRYTVNADEREAASYKAEDYKQDWLRLGAVSVTLEPQTVTLSTAKAPTVAEANGIPDKLRAMWELREENLGAKKEERLLDGLAELEQELS